MALVGGSGIYQSDIDRVARELRERGEDFSAGSILPRLIANARLGSLARRGRVSPQEANIQVPPQAWNSMWRAGWPAWSLGRDLVQNVRARSWIERRIADSLQIREEDCHAYYKAHSGVYVQPLRLRASHIFFAAPPDVAPEVVEAKRTAAQAVSDRLTRGERFADLVVLSEDEASKKHGGDLDFFSQSRMPPDFWAALRDLHVGETSGVIRTRLGFHIVQLTGSLPPRPMTFDDAQPEIMLKLQNQERAVVVRKLAATLSERPEFMRNESRD